MTADFVENGPQPGSNSPFQSQARAVYDQDMRLASLAFDENKGDLNVEVRIGAITAGARNKEIVYKQYDTKNREGDLFNGTSPPGIKSNSCGTDMKERAPVNTSIHGGVSEQHENLPLPAEISNLKLEDRTKVDEPQEKPVVRKAECPNEVETTTFVPFKPQEKTAVSQATPIQQCQLQYPQQGTSAGWENFLPQRNLRVLLVEDDDSTRHVVGALLRNCGYEVMTAASGLQAWELIQDKNNHFDLALTEVMLPSLSGISLLSKIMNQESCKHLPVVMMSSLDSVDVVFKCLSKGAVDFLVKPVRKNELKNLWQHVWRKCHSSSGSGSGSGSQTRKVANLKNMTGSGNSSDSESSSLNVGGGSDNGSGTQSCWTKKKAEAKSSGRPNVWETAQHPHEAFVHEDVQGNDGAPQKDHRRPSLDAIRGSTMLHTKAPDYMTGKCAETSIPRTDVLEYQVASSRHMQETNKNVHKVSHVNDVEQCHHLHSQTVAETVGGTSTSGTKVIDLLGNIAFQSKSKENHNSSEDGNLLDMGASNSPNTKDNISGSISLPTLELTLKRPHTAGEDEIKVEDREVLRQSGTSAFSRYGDSGTVLQRQPKFPAGSYAHTLFPLQSGYAGHTNPCITSTGTGEIRVIRTGSPADKTCLAEGAEVSKPNPLHVHLATRVNKKEMAQSALASSGQEILAQPADNDGASASGIPIAMVPSPATVSFKGVSAFGPLRNHALCAHSSKSTWAGTNFPESGEGFSQPPYQDNGRPLQSHQQVYHHHSHHYHHHIQHHYHHIRAVTKPEPLESPDGDQTVTNQGTGAPQCGSSNVMSHMAGNLGQSGSSNGYGTNGNGNGNGSVSGSNHGSNNHNGTSNGQSCGKEAAGGNGDSGNNTGNCGSGNGHGMHSVNGGYCNGVVISSEQNPFMRREAALNKFRQKRKERCFEKKVRYQSRKRLAEQRPRVRGQFVRQTILVSSTSEKEKEKYDCISADVDDDTSDAECA